MKCSICDYEFTRQATLKRHIQSVHEEKKPHRCSICDCNFSQKGNLKQHIKLVHMYNPNC